MLRVNALSLNTTTRFHGTHSFDANVNADVMCKQSFRDMSIIPHLALCLRDIIQLGQ